MDGRVLSEAFVGSGNEMPKFETEIMRAKTEFGTKVWQQYLKVSKVGANRYYDEGNAGTGPEER